ncbi:hypothetical protein NDU88_000468 [Pleurodeles waltl]|uniref:Uncharacterized protein n=1 Tax=Pleurodeles waltl TaxID=8319 RepID=A0AAV7N818_PLEWA|nr:hypothetical protein NDU88_000468 [Pleurodeles waltl]
MATDYSDWRCSRTSEDSGCRFHSSRGADPYTMTPEFRVRGEKTVDDGLHKEEEIEDGAGDARRSEKQTDAEGQGEEGGAGNSDVPNQKTGPRRTTSSEETRTNRHVPGGTWLNKVRSLFTGQNKRNTGNRDGGEEREDGEGRVEGGEQLRGLERGERVAGTNERSRKDREMSTKPIVRR